MCKKQKRVLSLDFDSSKKNKTNDIIEKFNKKYDPFKGFDILVDCPQKKFVKFWYPYMEKVIRYDEVSLQSKNAYDYFNDNKSRELICSTDQLWTREVHKLLGENFNELKEKDPDLYDYLVQLLKKPYLSQNLAKDMDSLDIQTSFNKSNVHKEFTMNFKRVTVVMEYCYQNEKQIMFFLVPFILNSLAISLFFAKKENVKNTKVLIAKPFILPFSVEPCLTNLVITLEDLSILIKRSLELCITCSQHLSIIDQHLKHLISQSQSQNEAKLGVISFFRSFTFLMDHLYISIDILTPLTKEKVTAAVLNLTKLTLVNEDLYNAIYRIIKKLVYFLFRHATTASLSSHQEKQPLSASDSHMTLSTSQKLVSQYLLRQLISNGILLSSKKTPIGDSNKDELTLFFFYRLLIDICPSQTRKLQKSEKNHILAVFETVRLIYWHVDPEVQRQFLFFLIQHFGHFVQAKANQGTGTNVSVEDIKLDFKNVHTSDLLALCDWKLIYSANLVIKLLIEKKHEYDRTFAFCFSTMLRACIELLSHHFKFYPCVEHLLQLQFFLMMTFESYTPLGSCLLRLGYELVNQNEKTKKTDSATFTTGLGVNKKLKGRNLFVLKEQNPNKIRIEYKPLILWVPHMPLSNASLLSYTENWIQLCHYYLSLISKHFSFAQVTMPFLFNFKKLIKNPNCTIRKQLKQCVKFIHDNSNVVELKKNTATEDSFQINSYCSIFMSPSERIYQQTNNAV